MTSTAEGDAFELPDSSLTFPEAFSRRAKAASSAEHLHAVRFERGSPVATPHSTGQLLDSVKRAAGTLVRFGVKPGARVIIAVSDPAAFTAHLLGAQCVGAIPVPSPSIADQQKSYADRIGSIARDARPAAVVVDCSRAAEALPDEIRLTTSVLDLGSSAIADGPATAPEGFRTACSPDDTAFLQYTSGSTASPKGVVVLHRNLIANLRAIIEGGDIGAEDVVFSWLPLFHDMGLVAGLLLGQYAGIPTYVAAPKSFVLRPDSWLRAVTAFRATFSAGPNFAFNVLARRVPDRVLAGIDLASWRLAFDGAELVDAETCHAFAERYRDCGFRERSLRPAYGLAEATLAVAFPRPGTAARFDCVDRSAISERGIAVPSTGTARETAVYTSVGTAVPSHTIRIVDPETGRSLPDRHVGEVVVSGPSVSPGYFSELCAGAAPRTELKTGDIGYVADKELYIVDRLKDLLIIAARKHIPSDIERTVAGLEGIRSNAVIAFSTRGSRGTEELGLVIALEPVAFRAKDALRDQIQQTVLGHFGLAAEHIVFVRPGDLPKTSSGKHQRARCQCLFETGELSENTSRELHRQ